MKDAIQKAIEVGWKKGLQRDADDLGYGKLRLSLITIPYPEIREDPFFWKSLGKALGWNNPENYQKGLDTLRAISGIRWREEWHRFVDHLIDGKDPEEFFNQLLKQP